MARLVGVMLLEFVCNAVGEFIISLGQRRLLVHLRMRLFGGVVQQAYARLENVDRGELQNRILVWSVT